MPRKPLILAAVIVALHLCEAATLGTTTAGSFLANLLQIFACGFAAVMAFGASRRGRGLSRPFWLIFGAGIAMWGVANLGWMYYEVVLHSEPPSTSAVRFLFGFESVLMAMALFLDQDSPRIDAESALDFLQIGIVFFFIYVEFYYLPAHRLDHNSAFLREMRVENAEDALLTALAETAYPQALWRPRSLPAASDGVRGAGPVPANRQARPNGDVAGPVMDVTVSRCCHMGGAVAAECCGGIRLTFAAEDGRRIDADQHHICAGAIDHTLAGLATGSGVARALFLASWRFHRVLRRAAGNQPVS